MVAAPVVTIPAKVKDPDAVLPFIWNWPDWLIDDDIITAAEIKMPTGLTLVSSQFNDTQVQAVISGGTVGQKYLVTAHITTQDNYEDDRSFYLFIKER